MMLQKLNEKVIEIVTENIIISYWKRRGSMMNKRSVCALGMAFVLAGCSAGGSGSGKEQTLTVGLFTEMNGDFSPMSLS